MPARRDLRPRPPPAKDSWLAECEAELEVLRPHLATYGGKLKRTIALQLWVRHQDGDPRVAARAWHKASTAE